MTNKTYVTGLGVLLVLIGALGFVPALTPNGQLLGLFATGTTHNIVHLLSGLVAFAAAANGQASATLYAKVFGVIYGVLTVVGFITGEGQIAGLIDVNQADNVLHLAIAATALYMGFGPASQQSQTV